MAPRDPSAEIMRLLQEIARLETELKTASLRDPQTLADYARQINELQREVLTHKGPPNGASK